jgi:rhodanese-related sulfurtransferase/precorrin-6B methylase 2
VTANGSIQQEAAVNNLRSIAWRRAMAGALVVGWMVGPALAQSATQEQARESWQRVDDIFKALGAREGAVIADVGAGPGFFTERLSAAVGPKGRVYAVDVDANALRRLQDRATGRGLTNVETVQGSVDDPKLPANTLDAALIVNAYHEMIEYHAMLTRIRAALKPSGRLVIVEPIGESSRNATRDAQTRQHQIAARYVQDDARAAGFRIVGLEDPFVQRPGHDYEYMLVLAPADPVATSTTPHVPPAATAGDDVGAAELRISAADFAPLQRSGKVIVLDVRDPSAYARGHIPGARVAQMSDLRNLVAELKAANVPIVAYCDCPAEESSARAVLYLRKQGITNTRALTGGWDKWVTSGGAVVTGAGPF